MKRTIGHQVNTEQYEHLLERASEICGKLLTEGEKILGMSVQQKPVWNLLPRSIVVTNKRVILHKPKLFKETFEDFLWHDLKKVHLTDHIFGSQLIFSFSNGYLGASYLPKNQAKKVYALSQSKEEEWVEKWRLRRIEEDRARSGANHIVVGSESSNGEKKNIKERLLELENLREEGLLTQDEYQNKKMEILELI